MIPTEKGLSQLYVKVCAVSISGCASDLDIAIFERVLEYVRESGVACPEAMPECEVEKLCTKARLIVSVVECGY